ncbi:hypothetical protein R3P38DRAFT_2797511 [Favolaschia claudopus]|uniref:Uncharacterized protein n=1 Tax=Favolaschia claudopus TaxID=2862362 RepID=A0AAW0A278_9AGAR
MKEVRCITRALNVLRLISYKVLRLVMGSPLSDADHDLFSTINSPLPHRRNLTHNIATQLSITLIVDDSTDCLAEFSIENPSPYIRINSLAGDSAQPQRFIIVSPIALALCSTFQLLGNDVLHSFAIDQLKPAASLPIDFWEELYIRRMRVQCQTQWTILQTVSREETDSIKDSPHDVHTVDIRYSVTFESLPHESKYDQPTLAMQHDVYGWTITRCKFIQFRLYWQLEHSQLDHTVQSQYPSSYQPLSHIFCPEQSNIHAYTNDEIFQEIQYPVWGYAKQHKETLTLLSPPSGYQPWHALSYTHPMDIVPESIDISYYNQLDVSQCDSRVQLTSTWETGESCEHPDIAYEYTSDELYLSNMSSAYNCCNDNARLKMIGGSQCCYLDYDCQGPTR